MAVADKNLHIFGELGALIIVNPFLIYILMKYANVFTNLERMFLICIIAITFIIDGYLLKTWI